MTGPVHSEAAAGRWWHLSLCEQLGNVGSEVSRALRWKSRNRRIAKGAIERALELLDLTLADPRYRNSVARLREIARTREVVVDFLLGSNEYGSTADSLRRYFDAYALAAALARERSTQG
ncbi:hypothetical protein GF402_08510 [Candidatus Fermentibacteria bacterium]|nr:hypothetical protein [Candidatus Fermentibacteria bacterium]